MFSGYAKNTRSKIWRFWKSEYHSFQPCKEILIMNLTPSYAVRKSVIAIAVAVSSVTTLTAIFLP